MTHPLDHEFDMVSETERMLDDEYVRVHIPENQEEKNLDLIINLALKSYKEQMEDIIHIEPKNRTKYLEVCERFLNQAKDAMYKKEHLKAQRERMSGPKQKQAQPQAEQQESSGTSRKELLARMRVVQ